MITTDLPKTIQASVHPDAINRVPAFFNATTGDVLNELLQNARRSGATRIDVTFNDESMTVRDDGRGIEDPAELLAFGQTGWDGETVSREHPAGMGPLRPGQERTDHNLVQERHRAGMEGWTSARNTSQERERHRLRPFKATAPPAPP